VGDGVPNKGAYKLKANLRNTTTKETTIILPANGKCNDDMVPEREDAFGITPGA
jgi:hypothetical protein